MNQNDKTAYYEDTGKNIKLANECLFTLSWLRIFRENATNTNTQAIDQAYKLNETTGDKIS